MATNLSDKMYYKIGEVAELAQVKTSVLRFWESEFSFLKPEKSSTGQRLYSRKEVELILQLRHLLYVEKYTIEGVKKKITGRGRLLNSVAEKQQDRHETVSSDFLKQLRQELLTIRDML